MRYFVVFSTVFPFFLFSQPSTLETRAQEYVNAGQWEKAIQAYRQLIAHDATKGLWWYRLGYAYHSTGQYKKAINAYEHAPYVFTGAGGAYNVACSFSRLKQTDSAFAWLNRAISLGLAQADAAAQDSDLVYLRTDPRFEKAIAAMKKAAAPCMYDRRYRVFDYWVGEWNVYNPQGRHAGNSSVQRILNGAVIFENWTSLGANYAGKSFNYLDTATGKWHQLWIDDKGNFIKFTGSMENGTMVYHSEGKDKQGKSFERKMSFFNISPDSVRQFSEKTYDKGKSWTTEYDLMYVRKKDDSKKQN